MRASRQLLATFIWNAAVQINVILELPGVSNCRHDKFPKKFAFTTPLSTSVVIIQSKSKKYGQSACDVTLRHVRATTVTTEKK